MPKIEFRANDSHGPHLDAFAFTHVSNLDFDQGLNPRFCLDYLEGLSGSETMDAHLSYIRNLDRMTRRLLVGTSLTSELLVAYFHIVECSNVSLGATQWSTLLSGSAVLVSYLDA